MSELNARLEADLRTLVSAGTGNWADVVRRSHRLASGRARRRRRLVLALAAVALVVGTGTALALGKQFFGWFTVSSAPERAPTLPGAAPYILGQRLYRAGHKPQRLAAPLRASLLGQDVTLVVAAPDGRRFAYHSWRANVPLLFVHDEVAGTDSVFARGAQTIAWGRDGRIAYVQGDPPRYRPMHGFRGRVMVRTPGAGPVAWTAHRGSYYVLAWARDRLLVGVRACLLLECKNDPEDGVYVLEQSGRLIPLRLAALTALSPDGRLAFGRYDPVPGQDSPSSLVRLVDVARGRVLTTLDLSQAARTRGLGGLHLGSLTSGAWRGSEIVATVAGEDNLLVALRVYRNQLLLEQVVRIPDTTLPNRWGISFGTPIFTGSGTRHVVVPVRGEIAPTGGIVAVLACDLRARHCVRGQVFPGREWFSVVSNPSRPAR
jgi:hypothetical protein